MRACELLWRNLIALNAAVDAAGPALAAIGLDAKQMLFLSLLDAHPHPAAIARAMVAPPPTVTFLAKRAQAAGLLRREAVPGDLRKYRLTLTPAGRRLLERGREALDRAFGERLASLSATERAAFERIVAKLGGATRERSGATLRSAPA